jgi:hypothetical protein
VDGSTQTWRVSLWGRIGVPVGGAALVGLLWADDDPTLAAIAVPVALIGWVFLTLRPRLTLDATTVTVVNPMSTTMIPLAEVDEIAPGWDGLAIGYRVPGGRKRTTAWAVQRSNFAAWNGWSRADAIAEEIRLGSAACAAQKPTTST